jgi:eukaryotic-like serine/threonine-protein kinase
VQSNFAEGGGQFSPDGRWVAYISTESESGRGQVFVAPFPGPGRRVQISAEGGGNPRWRGDGQELFFLTGGSDALMAATVDGRRQEFDPGAIRSLFKVPMFSLSGGSYDVTSDGQRFIVNTVRDQNLSTGSISVIVNWTAALKK